MKYYDKLVFELGQKGRKGYSLPRNSYGEGISQIPANLCRSVAVELPQVSEPEVVRHYTKLSNMNFGVDTGFYPLGSCTMKYNPKINEEMAALPAFADLHPLTPAGPDSPAQAALQVIYETSHMLSSLTGMAEFSLSPFAGAHGELTGLMVMKRYHESRGDYARKKVIVPDSAHGTNPASAAVCGFEVVQVKSTERGTVDVEDLRPLLDDSVAGIMMTNPNTLGLFETEIKEIASLVHNAGGLLYYDGANMNAILGKVRPGDLGFDIMHLNLHKTFSTPHGGGGPGAGACGVAAQLTAQLPDPRIEKRADGYAVVRNDGSLGRISGFMGNFGVVLRAYSYLLTLGKEDVKYVGPLAVLGANYIKECLKDDYKLPIDGICKHEFVFDGLNEPNGVTTLDVAKRLLDYGYHAPTIYFPLLFHQSIMIEPTETESKETLDGFIEVMHKIAKEARETPELVCSAPHNAPISRPDETRAATHTILKYKDLQCE